MSTREQLEQALAAQEALRATLGDALVDATVAAIREKLAALEPETRPSAPVLHGERKLVTILYADLAGFTALAETLDPESVRDLMNTCFERLVPPIEKYEGTVDKFIGDCIMALFGAPITHENDAERALRAALDMRAVMADFNAEHGTDLGLHFGINTGMVIAGGIGTQEQQAYSVMGNAVNLAARLEALSQRGEILVGVDTQRLTAPLFEFEALPPITIKGYSDAVSIYRLHAAKCETGDLRGIAGLDSPLVGRAAEFHALQEGLAALQHGEGRLVTLYGEAGLGKSRLSAEVRCAAANLGDITWLEGRCLSYGVSLIYLLWIDILRDLLGTQSEDAPSVVSDCLQARVQTLCPTMFDEVYPFLARLLTLPLTEAEEARLHSLDAAHIKAGTFAAVTELLRAQARRQPLVIMCEDLHWAGSTSLELLQHVFTLVTEVPLYLLLIFRPEYEHPCWQLRAAAARYAPRHLDLALEPLNLEHSQALVHNLLRVEDLPGALCERILARAEGNPLYVEEIIRALMDEQAITRNPATCRWSATRQVDAITIPETLHGVLTARIDRLEEETKHVLQLAAVIGRIFFYRVLAAIAHEQQALDARLLTLQQEQMIRERARLPELEYIFEHQLTQEAAYNGLLKKDRRRFHQQVAEVLERLFPERVEAYVGLLAYHWERAESADKAVPYLLQAGDQARLAYAYREAIDYYQRALRFLREGGAYARAARTLMKLGLTYHTAFDSKRARQAYDEAFTLSQQDMSTDSAALHPAAHPLRVCWGGDPPTLDPSVAADDLSLDLIEQLFSPLVELTAKLNVIPCLATNWEVEAGGRCFTFYLRDDITWSDGVPVTAADFEFAWKRVLDSAFSSLNAPLLYDIEGAEAYHQGYGARAAVGIHALDAQTLQITLNAPTSYFLYVLTCRVFAPLPQHVLARHGAAWAEPEHIVTNGPFRITHWEKGQAIHLRRDPAYRGQFLGNLEQIHINLCPLTRADLLDRYAVDEIDILPLPSEDIIHVRQRYPDDYMVFPGTQTSYIGFNIGEPPFDDVRVRRALAQAIDKESLANSALNGNWLPALGGFIPPYLPGHSPNIGLPYQPQAARQALAQAGYAPGVPLPPFAAVRPALTANRMLTQFVSACWQEQLGLTIVWEEEPWADYLARLRNGVPPLYSIGWMPDYPDPDSFMRVGLRREHIQWEHPEYVALIERARRVYDQQERLRLYRRADQILIEEAVIIPLLYTKSQILVKPSVKHYPLNSIGGPLWKHLVLEA